MNDLAAFLRRAKPAWMRRGACRDQGTEAFFGRASIAAKDICGGCDVQYECLAYALKHDELVGVWGGHTTTERQRIRGGAT